MARGPVNVDLMVRYLLGDLSDQERERLEQIYFADDDAFAQLSALEDELVDDYVRGHFGGLATKTVRGSLSKFGGKAKEACVCRVLLSVLI